MSRATGLGRRAPPAAAYDAVTQLISGFNGVDPRFGVVAFEERVGHLPDVPVHIIQPPCVGLERANRRREIEAILPPECPWRHEIVESGLRRLVPPIGQGLP